jgi:hypothetical protein
MNSYVVRTDALNAADPDGRSARYLRHGRALWEYCK